MAWWKQAFVAAAAFWSGNVFMYLWFTRNFGQLGQGVSYVQACLLAFSGIAVLASALIAANLSRTKQSPQP